MTISDLTAGLRIHEIQAEDKTSRPTTVIWHPLVCAAYAEKSRKAIER